MSDKDVQFWSQLMYAMHSQGLAGLLAFALGMLRLAYDKSEPSLLRSLLESSLGSCITVVVGMTAVEFGLSGGWAFACAGAVGTFGVVHVRDFAERWANRKVGDTK